MSLFLLSMLCVVIFFSLGPSGLHYAKVEEAECLDLCFLCESLGIAGALFLFISFLPETSRHCNQSSV